MATQQDSLTQNIPVLTEIPSQDSVQYPSARPQTPYQVLRSLPKDATPAQQDSAIQAWFEPAEIRYSERPDTLHLPGHGVGKSIMDVDIPQYYRENFFSKDTLLHPELKTESFGIAGTPVPYTIKGDDVISSFLLGCFVIAIWAFIRVRSFFIRELKNFFYTHRVATQNSETAKELRYELVMVLQTGLLCSILFYFYAVNHIADTFILTFQFALVWLYLLVFLVYFVLKLVLYSFVHQVFWDSKKNTQWVHSFVLLIMMEGIFLLPIALLLVYGDLPLGMMTKCCVSVLILIKILSFYRTYCIFFKQNGLKLQIILYFCALEIPPLLALWGILVMMTNHLKINF